MQYIYKCQKKRDLQLKFTQTAKKQEVRTLV
jgi:hypothetical protein